MQFIEPTVRPGRGNPITSHQSTGAVHCLCSCNGEPAASSVTFALHFFYIFAEDRRDGFLRSKLVDDTTGYDFVFLAHTYLKIHPYF